LTIRNFQDLLLIITIFELNHSFRSVFEWADEKFQFSLFKDSRDLILTYLSFIYLEESSSAF